MCDADWIEKMKEELRIGIKLKFYLVITNLSWMHREKMLFYNNYFGECFFFVKLMHSELEMVFFHCIRSLFVNDPFRSFFSIVKKMILIFYLFHLSSHCSKIVCSVKYLIQKNRSF